MASVQQHTVFNQKGIKKNFHYGQVCLTVFPKFFNHRHLPLRGASESVLCLGTGDDKEGTLRWGAHSTTITSGFGGLRCRGKDHWLVRGRWDDAQLI